MGRGSSCICRPLGSQVGEAPERKPPPQLFTGVAGLGAVPHVPGKYATRPEMQDGGGRLARRASVDCGLVPSRNFARHHIEKIYGRAETRRGGSHFLIHVRISPARRPRRR